MGTIRIALRTETKDKDGLCSLQIVYQISSDRKRLRTDLKTRPEYWNNKKQQVIYLNKKAAKVVLPGVDFDTLPSEKEVEELNAKITALKKEITDLEKYFEIINEEYTTSKIIDSLKDKHKPLGIKQSKSKEVYSYIDKYIATHQLSRKAGSLVVYSSLKTHLGEFQKFSKREVTFDALDYSFFKEFQNFLLSPHQVYIESKSKKEPKPQGKWRTVSLNNTTVNKQLSTLKTFINYARKEGIKVNEQYKEVEIGKEDLEVIALTNEEFEKLFYLDLPNDKRLAEVRDVFCFSCVTGLRYSDLAQLKRVHIQNSELNITVEKTKQKLTIPLNDYAKYILAKYKDNLAPLPVISNAKMNKHLKKLGELAGINDEVEKVRHKGSIKEVNVYPKYELITVHIGRKTFVTLSLEQGMPSEVIKSITGHKDHKSFERYVKVTEKRKQAVMAKAWRMPDINKLKAVS